MKGRTNLSGGSGGLVINSDIISAEVTGGNIVAGDFVSYESSERSSLIEGVAVSSLTHVKDDYYVTIFNNGLHLLLYDGSSVETKFVYNEVSILAICILSDYGILCAASGKFIKLKIENDELILVFAIETTVPNNPQFMYVWEDNLICINHGANTAYLYCYFYDFSLENNDIEFRGYKNLSLTTKFNANTGWTFWSFEVFEGDVYFLLDYSVGSSSSIVYYNCVAGLYIDYSNNTFDIGIYTFMTKRYGTYYGGGAIGKKISDKYYIVFYKTWSSSVSYSFSILVYNLASRTCSTYNGLFDSSFTANFFSISTEFGNGKFALLFNEKIALLQIDESVQRPLLLGQPFEFASTKNASEIIKREHSFVITVPSSQDTTCLFLSSDDNDTNIVSEINKDKVKLWDGNVWTIGVAKDSGIEGDIIDVYVPLSVTT